jgi:hypothetical protein
MACRRRVGAVRRRRTGGARGPAAAGRLRVRDPSLGFDVDLRGGGSKGQRRSGIAGCEKKEWRRSELTGVGVPSRRSRLVVVL